MKINEDNIFPVLVVGTLSLTACTALIGAILVSWRFSLSVVAGGVLATANFCWLRAGLASLLQTAEGSGAARSAVLKYLLRLTVLGLQLYVLIVMLHADVFGLLLGLSILVVSIIVFAIYISTRKGG